MKIKKIEDNSRKSAYLVFHSEDAEKANEPVGYIRKFKNTRTDFFPFQAHLMDQPFEGRMICGTHVMDTFTKGKAGLNEAASAILSKLSL